MNRGVDANQRAGGRRILQVRSTRRPYDGRDVTDHTEGCVVVRAANDLAVAALMALIMSPLALAQEYGTREFIVELSGRATRPVAGDFRGKGRARITIDLETGQLCYEIRVEDIAPATSAHVHSGNRNAFGPVEVELDPPADGASNGCVAVEVGRARAIARQPTYYYVDVHNADFPNGALRGQLKLD